MSEMAKAARAAMKKKAKSMTTADPHQKVDSSTWTQAEPLDANVKTGMRPVSRRAFKKGGKVEGECAPMRADRKPRKAGGSAKAWVDAKINRNVKDANEEREGIKHIGGMKKGGRAKHATDGKVADPDTGSRTGRGAVTRNAASAKAIPQPMRRPAEPDYDTGSRTGAGAVTEERKAGGRAKGRAKKFLGGPMMQPGGMLAGASPAGGGAAMGAGGMDPNVDPRENLVDKSRFNFGAGTNANPNLKRGGKAVKHDDVKADKALIKKMVKPAARTGKAEGGWTPNLLVKTTDKPLTSQGKPTFGDNPEKEKTFVRDNPPQPKPKASGGRAKREAGGKVFSGEGYPHKIPGVVPGGRTAHASGGKTGKGKTNVNIIIATGQQGQGQQPGMAPPPGGMPKPPGGMPVQVAPPPAAGVPAIMPMPMPMPMAGPAGPAGPPGMAGPMGRKSGGRTFSSYKDMKAGAGSGDGRLEKEEIQEHKRMMRKDGGHVFPKMKFGAGSGEGRVEKTDKYGLTGSGKSR